MVSGFDVCRLGHTLGGLGSAGYLAGGKAGIRGVHGLRALALSQLLPVRVRHWGVSEPGGQSVVAFPVAQVEAQAVAQVSVERWRTPDGRHAVKEWRCCGLVWQLMLSRLYPGRQCWTGPVCPRCGSQKAGMDGTNRR